LYFAHTHNTLIPAYLNALDHIADNHTPYSFSIATILLSLKATNNQQHIPTSSINKKED
jgi:hypothetical protein